MPNIFPNQNKELIIRVVPVSCSQVNGLMIKINKLFHKLAVAHYGTYNAPLVIGLSCWFFHFWGQQSFFPCCLPHEVWIPETGHGLAHSVQLTDMCVCVCERSFAHHYILQGLEPSKSSGLCQFPLFQGKADRKCSCRWRRFLQGDSALFLFHNAILWWALDFLSGIHETSFWLQRAISGRFIAPKPPAQAEEYILVTIFSLVPCVLLSLMFLCSIHGGTSAWV